MDDVERMKETIRVFSNQIVEAILQEDLDAGVMVKLCVGNVLDSVCLKLPREKRLQVYRIGHEDDLECWNNGVAHS